MSKKKSSPAYCKQKINCKNIHAHYKQKNYTLQTKPRTLQTKLQHAANKTLVRCKQNFSTLQAKENHAANKTHAQCKQNSSALKTKELYAANKTPAHCKVLPAQGDVKDVVLVVHGGVFTERDSCGCHENSDPSNFFKKVKVKAHWHG